jgi:cytochrome c oxidase accessory protein FixG
MPLAENDTVVTIGHKGRRIWLYPETVAGRFLQLRSAVHVIHLLVLLAGPWVDIAGHPAVRVDLPHRRIYFFGLKLFATDGSYLLFLFGFVLFFTFLMTALFGRAWCGWSCPQTVFMESLIRPIERLIEGTPAQRRKRDAAAWKVQTFARKLFKWTTFTVVAGVIATTFLAYFMGRDAVIEAQLNPLSHPVGTTFFVVLTGLLAFDFIYFREQTCMVVCPYGRFQSVLLDANSIAVGYDARRGEPRGKKTDPNAGACVDCKRCIQVCPTGIDIRKGVQMECIQCMACIDACDAVMDKLERPRGLIRFASLNALEGKATQVIRTRVVAYALGLVAVSVAFAFTVSGRAPVQVQLSRQVTAPWAVLADGRVQNGTNVRVQNKSDVDRTFDVVAVDPPELELLMPISPLRVPHNQTVHAPLFLILPGDVAAAGTSAKVELRDDQGFAEQLTIEFMAPGAAIRTQGGDR